MVHSGCSRHRWRVACFAPFLCKCKKLEVRSGQVSSEKSYQSQTGRTFRAKGYDVHIGLNVLADFKDFQSSFRHIYAQSFKAMSWTWAKLISAIMFRKSRLVWTFKNTQQMLWSHPAKYAKRPSNHRKLLKQKQFDVTCFSITHLNYITTSCSLVKYV